MGEQAERPMTSREAAAWLGLSQGTVQTMARAGRLPATRMPGGQWRFWSSELRAMLEARREAEAERPRIDAAVRATMVEMRRRRAAMSRGA